MKNMKYLSIVLLLFCISACGTVDNERSLDIDKFLSLADNNIYPTESQIKMLLPLVPDETYTSAPSVNNRDYWNKIAKSEDGKKIVDEAISFFNRKPEVPISDEIYRKANKGGIRGIYKPRYYRTMDRLEKFVLAECIENKGRFIPQIEVYCDSIMAMKSWMHPNHDDKENSVLEGKRVAIDLGARKFGMVLALSEDLLGDKLSSTLRTKIDEQLKWRIKDSYFKSAKGLDNVGNQWIRSLSNWNAVCTSGSVFTILSEAENKEERAAAVGCAINSMKYYLSGFGNDGYCSEGVGYWGYGFGHYLYLAEMLYDYTDGKVDLFKFNDYEKLKNVAHFPYLYEIQNGMFSPFSDSSTTISSESDNFAALMSAKHYGTPKPEKFVSEEAVGTIIGWRDAPLYTSNEKSTWELPDVTFFDDYGIVVSRGKQENPFSVTIKAGHNAENHNHSDVGSYVVLLGKDIMAGDIGAPSYIAGAFSPENPARSSWGHPVPRVDNTLQSNGFEFKGEVIKTDFKSGYDSVVMSLKKAYEVSSLKSLDRTMVNDKSNGGTITVSDEFTSSKPIDFGTSVMVNVDYKIDGNIIYITSENQKIKAEISAEGGEIVIKDEVVPVKHLRSGKTSYRIGIDFTKPLDKGTISVKYTPLG